jgi:hypothetical protein
VGDAGLDLLQVIDSSNHRVTHPFNHSRGCENAA